MRTCGAMRYKPTGLDKAKRKAREKVTPAPKCKNNQKIFQIIKILIFLTAENRLLNF